MNEAGSFRKPARQNKLFLHSSFCLLHLFQSHLAARATVFRNDLAYAANPAVSKNPHTFLTNVVGAGAPYALAAQHQIATFFASDGAATIDPDGPGPFFETPTSLLPEDLAFIP